MRQGVVSRRRIAAGGIGPDYDRRVIITYVVLAATGVWLVASSSSFFSAAKYDDPYLLMKRHLLRLAVAAVFLLITMRIDYRFYRRIATPCMALALIMLLGLFLFGQAIRSSQRWYHLGALRMTLQPAEPARVALVVFLAHWVAKKKKELEDGVRGFLPPVVVVSAMAGLVALQPNYGSACATVLVALVVLYVGGARLRHLTAFSCFFASVLAAELWRRPYLHERMVAFFHRSKELLESNWQLYQSLLGLGTGGIWGSGFGASKQKLSWLPDSHTDFIFSILGEETGFIGAFALSLLFLLLALRALKIARSCGDLFGELLAIGLGGGVYIYAALNMMVATGLLPVAGLPLPMISYGGSALVANSVSIGILLNVSLRKCPTRPRWSGGR